MYPVYGGRPSDVVPKSDAAARKALELDPTLAHPHAVLAGNLMEYDWDFAAGISEYKKALELDPNDATAHQWYATDIGQMGGREQEALAEINRAHQLDPLSPIVAMTVGQVQFLARKYDESVTTCKELASENPTFARSHFCLATTYWAKGMYPQAVDEFKRYSELAGNQHDSEFASALEKGFQSGGWKSALGRAIEVRLRQRQAGYTSASEIAGLYACLGEKDEAFHWLDIAYQEHDYDLEGLRIDFRLDPLHSDSRFADLVKKVGLP